MSGFSAGAFPTLDPSMSEASFTSPVLYTYSGYIQDASPQPSYFTCSPPSLPSLCTRSTDPDEIQQRWSYYVCSESPWVPSASVPGPFSPGPGVVDAVVGPSSVRSVTPPEQKLRSPRTSSYSSPCLRVLLYSRCDSVRLHAYVELEGYVEADEEGGAVMHVRRLGMGRPRPMPHADVTEDSVRAYMSSVFGRHGDVFLMWLLGRQQPNSVIGSVVLSVVGDANDLVPRLARALAPLCHDSAVLDWGAGGEIKLRKVGEDRLPPSPLQGAPGKVIFVPPGASPEQANYLDQCVSTGKIPCSFGFYEGKMDGCRRYLFVSGSPPSSSSSSCVGPVHITVRGLSLSVPPPPPPVLPVFPRPRLPYGRKVVTPSPPNPPLVLLR